MKEGKEIKIIKKHIQSSIGKSIYSYFDSVGLEKAKYEYALKLAQVVKEDTKFNSHHWAWYRKKYREIKEDEALKIELASLD